MMPAAADTAARTAVMAVAWLAVLFVPMLAAEAISIAWRLSSAAAVGIVWYGMAFLGLAAYRLPWALLGLVVALPLFTVEVLVPGSSVTLSTDKVALAAVTAVWCLTRIRRLPALAGVPAVRWWLVFLAITVASALASGARPRELVAVGEHLTQAVVFLMALDVFRLHEPGLQRRTVHAAVATAGIVAALGALEWALNVRGVPAAFYFKHGTIDDLGLRGATISAPNFLAGYLVLIVPALVVLAVGAKGRWRAAAIAGVVFSAIALRYADALGAWLGLLVATLVAFGLTVVFDSSFRMRLAFGLALVPLLGIGTATLLDHLRPEYPAVPLRLAAYQVAVEAVKERPLLGFGSNAYEREYGRLEQRLFGRELLTFHPPGRALSAHSSYVDIAVERGLLGLGAFVGLLVAVGVTAVKGWIAAPRGPERTLLLALLAGLAAFCAQAMTENLFQYSKIAAVFWVLAAATQRLAPPAPRG